MKLPAFLLLGAALMLSGCLAANPYDPIGGKMTIARQSALIANGGYIGGPANN